MVRTRFSPGSYGSGGSPGLSVVIVAQPLRFEIRRVTFSSLGIGFCPITVASASARPLTCAHGYYPGPVEFEYFDFEIAF